MFEKGMIVRYGQTGLCKIEDVCLKKITDQAEEYYVLTPLFKAGSYLYVPVANPALVERMLPPLTKEEIDEVLSDVAKMEPDWLRDFRRRSEQSKKALASGDRREALFLIKNIYARKKEMLGEGKHLHTTDDYFLKDAETLIFNEFSFVLGKAFSQVKEEALKILNIE